MFERGGFSFVALLVINPIIILLFQNCALIPETQSEYVAKNVKAPQRNISSVSANAKSETKECLSNKQNCPVAASE